MKLGAASPNFDFDLRKDKREFPFHARLDNDKELIPPYTDDQPADEKSGLKL